MSEIFSRRSAQNILQYHQKTRVLSFLHSSPRSCEKQISTAKFPLVVNWITPSVLVSTHFSVFAQWWNLWRWYIAIQWLNVSEILITIDRSCFQALFSTRNHVGTTGQRRRWLFVILSAYVGIPQNQFDSSSNIGYNDWNVGVVIFSTLEQS